MNSVDSNDVKDYFDTEDIENTSISNNSNSNNSNDSNDYNEMINNIKNNNSKNSEAIAHIDGLFDENNKASFEDVGHIDKNDIKSIFTPQVIIGKGSSGGDGGGRGFGSSGDSSSWNSAFNHDGMEFDDSMRPSKNLWKDDHSSYDKPDDCPTDQWSKSMDSYNKGKWNPNLDKKPSDYVDYYNPSAYGTTTPGTTTDEYGQTKKLCGEYDTQFEDEAENLLVRNYTQAKKYFPGYTYVPPSRWDVPQKHIGICRPDGPNVHRLTGLIDRGLPLNVLELNPNGSIADTEDAVNLTNVGSMMPKFNYQEQPFSKPYV